MSSLHHPRPAPALDLDAASGARMLRRALAWLVACHARQSQRHALADLDDRRLQDLGLSRTDVAAEMRKPFWTI
jgi:uncharacterized protein YjiS (DUF1127 family)